MSKVSRLELVDANEMLRLSRRLAFAAQERLARKPQLDLAQPATDGEMLQTIEAVEVICRRLRTRYTLNPSGVSRHVVARRIG